MTPPQTQASSTQDACANSNANPLMLLACSVNTPIHAHRFHLLCVALRVLCELDLRTSGVGCELGGPIVTPKAPISVTPHDESDPRPTDTKGCDEIGRLCPKSSFLISGLFHSKSSNH